MTSMTEPGWVVHNAGYKWQERVLEQLFSNFGVLGSFSVLKIEEAKES